MHSHIRFDRFLLANGVGLIIPGALVVLFGASLERPHAPLMFLGLVVMVCGVMLMWPSRVTCRVTPCRKSSPRR